MNLLRWWCDDDNRPSVHHTLLAYCRLITRTNNNCSLTKFWIRLNIKIPIQSKTYCLISLLSAFSTSLRCQSNHSSSSAASPSLWRGKHCPYLTLSRTLTQINSLSDMTGAVSVEKFSLHHLLHNTTQNTQCRYIIGNQYNTATKW